jgi:hypothetical protein
LIPRGYITVSSKPAAAHTATMRLTANQDFTSEEGNQGLTSGRKSLAPALIY